MSSKQKVRLSKELEKVTIDSKPTELLKAFQTDELKQSFIGNEVDLVRAQQHAKRDISKAHFLVTGDKDLLVLKRYGLTKLLTQMNLRN